MIRIVKAPPYLAVQDAGRPGFRRMGVPLSGAMDQWALAAGNALVGNPTAFASLEWALAGGVIAFAVDCAVAVTGARARATVRGVEIPLDEVVDIRAGDELEIHGFSSGRFAYVAVAGGIAVDPVMGSRATYLPASFGGFHGRLLRDGDAVPLGETPQPSRRSPAYLASVPPDYTRETVRAILSPEISAEMRDHFVGAAYMVSTASDRTGYRLEGDPLRLKGPVPLSVAVCPGTVQLPPSGLPIVLLADAPTIGGYSVLAVVCAVDLPILAQRAPGEGISFEPISVDEAQSLLRARAAELAWAEENASRYGVLPLM
jgi:antagonist of KipI